MLSLKNHVLQTYQGDVFLDLNPNRGFIILIIQLFMGLSLIACRNKDLGQVNKTIETSPDSSCTGLFGMPNEQSGVESDRCGLTCTCAQGEVSFQQANTNSTIFNYTHINSMPPLSTDPYKQMEEILTSKLKT